MSTALPLLLTHEQATRLHTYIQTYRRYALTALLPSAERNMILRVLQTVQGKLIGAMDQTIVQLSLFLIQEEVTTVKAAMTTLVSLYSTQPESAERIATLSDLVALKVRLREYEQSLRSC